MRLSLSMLRHLTRWAENLRLALQNIRSSRLRSILTMLIVAIGIMAVMGMLTVISALRYTMENDFASMQGASLEIYGRRVARPGSPPGAPRPYHPIRYADCQRFREYFDGPAYVGTQLFVGEVTARYGSRQSRPMLAVYGVDAGYMLVERFEVKYGRIFSIKECEGNDPIVLLGDRIADQLFPDASLAVGQQVMLGSRPFTVVGVLSTTTASMFGSVGGDRIVVPLRAGMSRFQVASPDYDIVLRPFAGVNNEGLTDYAQAAMRKARLLTPIEPDNFQFWDADDYLEQVFKSLGQIGIAAFLIALITLLGSSVGLTNIMLASVTERTREIGVRKALGAYPSTIRQQFLIESIMITLIGGFVGVILGLLLGFGIARLMDIIFVMPWTWTLLSLILSMLVGMASGYLPARRAARLDPILALHYE